MKLPFIFIGMTLFSTSAAHSARLLTLDQLSKKQLSEGCSIEVIQDRDLVIYSLLPADQQRGYKIEIFDASQRIPDHLHEEQTQYLFVLEGQAEFFNGLKSVVLTEGEFLTIPPKSVHSIEPRGHVRFLSIDIPGYDFPNDTVLDETKFKDFQPKFSSFVFQKTNGNFHLNQITKIEPKFITSISSYLPARLVRKDSSKSVNPLAGNDRWQLSLIDLDHDFEAPTSDGIHHFLMLSGVLRVKSDLTGETTLLNAGQSMHIQGKTSQALKIEKEHSSRILYLWVKPEQN